MNIRVPKSPLSVDMPSTTSVAAVEALLQEWFGAPVVLVSAGRSAILLTLQVLGLSRYRSRVAVPRFIARCVIDSISNSAFPIDVAERHEASPDATIYFHQYGFPQLTRPEGPNIIEDISHSFFFNADTGKRPWAGELAIFSLPKFFSTTALLGGIVATDPAMAARLRAARDAVPLKSADAVAEDARIFRDHTLVPTIDLELMYLSRLFNPAVRDEELGGLPQTLQNIQEMGAHRRAVLEALIATAGSLVPEGWSDMLIEHLPYALSLRGSSERLAAINAQMRTAGIATDIYQIDTARNMYFPVYEPMLLVPYSQYVSDDILADMTAILAQPV